MTNNRFEEFMNDLEQYYNSVTPSYTRPGKKAMAEYWKAIDFVPNNMADQLYSRIVNAYKYFPRIAEIRQEARGSLPERQRLTNPTYCYHCLNVGTIPYYQKGLDPFQSMEYQYMARCPFCNAGQNYSEYPAASDILTAGELQWLYEQNLRMYGQYTQEQVKQAKKEVTRFVKSFGSVGKEKSPIRANG